MWLLGWTCDWPGPDNFLNTAFFHFQGDKPNPEFAYGPPELKAAFDAAAIAPDEATAKTAWEKAQDILAKDLPTAPARPLQAAGRGQGLRQGLPRRRQPQRAACGPSGSTSNPPYRRTRRSFPRGPQRPRGNASSHGG